jgi:transposase
VDTNGTFVGLDVHKESTAVAVLRPGTLEPDHRVIATTPDAYRKLVKAVGTRSVVFCYEAGPCGFDPYRMLTANHAVCDVIAPTLIPRRSGRKVKTDRIDARALARLHRAGELTTVRVPTAAEEAVRDLIRVREDVKQDRRRAIQRLKSFLLRYGQRYPKLSVGWSQPFENWVCALRLEHECAQEALDHLIAGVQTRHSELGIARQPDRHTGRPAAAAQSGRDVARLQRDRHVVRRDGRCRDRRLQPVPASRVVHGLRRSGTERAFLRAA